MKSFTRGLVMSLVAAGFVGSAADALAAGSVECSITKNGKQSTQMVSSSAECTKLGGKVVQAKPGAATKPATR